jgi:hypothetical protein
MVVAEICTATYFIGVTRQAFQEYGKVFSPQGPILAAGQALVAIACLGGVLATTASPLLCVGTALAAHTMLLGLQIRTLRIDLISKVVRHAMLGLHGARGRTGRA